jgi:hypothetical protein
VTRLQHTFPGFSRTPYNHTDTFHPQAAAQGTCPRPDFHLPPIKLDWIKDPLVRATVDPKRGFRTTIDETKRGHMPSVLNLSDPDELAYVLALLDANRIKRARGTWNHKHFFTRKTKDDGTIKLRLVFHGRALSRASAKPPHFKVHAYKTLAKSARRSRYAALFDLAHFYFNNHLHADIQRFFGMHTSIGDFVWLVTPFGWNWAAFLGHCLAKQFILHLRNHPDHPIDISHYMDDCSLWADTLTAAMADLAFALDVAEQLGLSVSHGKTVQPCGNIKIIGVIYDLVNKTSSLAPSYFRAVRNHLRRVEENGGATRNNVAEVLGSLVFANHAYPGSLSLCYELLRLAAQLEMPWHSRLGDRVAKRFLTCAEYTIARFAELPPCALQSTDDKPEMYWFDATPTQIGLVGPDVYCAEAIPHIHIYLGEAEGLDLALEESAGHSVVTFTTDNMALYWAVRKGWSPNLAVNRIVQKMLARRLAGDRLFIRWVPSAQTNLRVTFS